MTKVWRYAVQWKDFSTNGDDSAFSSKEDALQRARIFYRMGKHKTVRVFDVMEMKTLWENGKMMGV